MPGAASNSKLSKYRVGVADLPPPVWKKQCHLLRRFHLGSPPADSHRSKWPSTDKWSSKAVKSDDSILHPLCPSPLPFVRKVASQSSWYLWMQSICKLSWCIGRIPDQAVHEDTTACALLELLQSLQAPVSKDRPIFAFLKSEQHQWRNVSGWPLCEPCLPHQHFVYFELVQNAVSRLCRIIRGMARGNEPSRPEDCSTNLQAKGAGTSPVPATLTSSRPHT